MRKGKKWQGAIWIELGRHPLAASRWPYLDSWLRDKDAKRELLPRMLLYTVQGSGWSTALLVDRVEMRQIGVEGSCLMDLCEQLEEMLAGRAPHQWAVTLGEWVELSPGYWGLDRGE